MLEVDNFVRTGNIEVIDSPSLLAEKEQPMSSASCAAVGGELSKKKKPRRKKKKNEQQPEQKSDNVGETMPAEPQDTQLSVLDPKSSDPGVWLAILRKCSDRESVENFLRDLYNIWLSFPSETVFKYFLDFLELSPGIDRPKIGGYAGHVLFHFEIFLSKEEKLRKDRQNISEELRKRAFCIVTCKNHCYLSRVSKIFLLRQGRSQEGGPVALGAPPQTPGRLRREEPNLSESSLAGGL